MQRSAGGVGETAGRGENVARALHGAFCRGASRRDILSLAVRKIRDFGPRIVGTYVYLLEGDSLELEAQDGKRTAHSRIRLPANTRDPASIEHHLTTMIQPEWLADCAIVALIHRHDLVLGSVLIRAASPLDRDSKDVVQVADALAALL